MEMLEQIHFIQKGNNRGETQREKVKPVASSALNINCVGPG